MRDLGLVVCRGTSIMLICPADGMEEIGMFIDFSFSESNWLFIITSQSVLATRIAEPLNF